MMSMPVAAEDAYYYRLFVQAIGVIKRRDRYNIAPDRRVHRVACTGSCSVQWHFES